MVQKLIEILNKQLKPIFKKCGEFSIKKENILGVVLKDNEIQIIELLKKKSSWFAKGYTYQQIAGIGKDQDIFSASTYLSDQVKNALDSINSKVTDVSISINSSNVQNYNLQTPLMPTEELKEVVSGGGFWEQFDETPDSLEESYTSYQVISRDEELEVMNISLLTIEKKLADVYVNIFRLAGLNPVILDIGPMTQINAIAAAIGKENFDTPVAIFNYTKSSSYLTVASNSGFSITDINIVEADQVLLDTIEEIDEVTSEFWDEIFERLASQIKQGLIEFETKYECDPISLITVATDKTKTNNLFVGLEKQLGELVIKSYDPEESITFGDNEKKYLDSLSSKSETMECIGAGVRKLNAFEVNYEEEIYNHNLLPRAEQLKINKKSTVFAKYCYCLSLAIFLVGAIHLISFKFLKILENDGVITQLKGVIEQVKSNETIVKGYKGKASRISKDVQSLQAFGENKKTTAEIFNSLAINVPESIRLTSFKIREQRNVVIEGVSKEDASIVNMFDLFSASKVVELAKLGAIEGITEEERKQLYTEAGKPEPASIPKEMISKKFTINLTLRAMDGEIFDDIKKVKQFKKSAKIKR